MKIFIIIFLTLICESVNAISYNNSSIFSLPNFYDNNGVLLYSVNTVGNSLISDFTSTSSSGILLSTYRFETEADIIRFKSGSMSFSGEIYNDIKTYNYVCSSSSCSYDASIFQIFSNSGFLTYKIWLNSFPVQNFQLLYSGSLGNFPLGNCTYGKTTDCVLAVVPNYVYSDELIFGGTYLFSILFNFYDLNGEFQTYKKFFGTTDRIQPNKLDSFFASFSPFQFSNQYGLKLSNSNFGDSGNNCINSLYIICYSYNSDTLFEQGDAPFVGILLGTPYFSFINHNFPNWFGSIPGQFKYDTGSISSGYSAFTSDSFLPDFQSFVKTSTGFSNTGVCTTIDSSLHYFDKTNYFGINGYTDNLAFLEFFTNFGTSIVNFASVSTKVFLIPEQICLFGQILNVPTEPIYYRISNTASFFQGFYNDNYGNLRGGKDLGIYDIQGFLDLFFVFVYTFTILTLIKVVFILQV